MTSATKGKFIILYGINNLGKSTQAKKLVERLDAEGFKTEYLKYPIYDLEPSGLMLNNFLRQGNYYSLSPREAQIIYALNRTQYEKTLLEKLEDGINIVAEDYVGSGLAWGIGSGVDENFLKTINSHLLKSDLAFLFDGERFQEAIEKTHKFENDKLLIDNVREIHKRLGSEYGWINVNANLTIEQVHQVIWHEVINLLDPKRQFRSKHTSTPENNNFWENIIENEYPIHPDNTNAKNSETPNSKNSHQQNILKIERLSSAAQLPTRSHPNDAGLDLYSADFYSLLPGEKVLVRTGIKMAIPDGFAGLIWDKSGIAKGGIKTMGGVIDSGYRGEILINIINLSNSVVHIARGQKIAQILIQKIETPIIMEVSINDHTERGSKGHGSTGLF